MLGAIRGLGDLVLDDIKRTTEAPSRVSCDPVQPLRVDGPEIPCFTRNLEAELVTSSPQGRGPFSGIDNRFRHAHSERGRFSRL